MGKKQVLDSRGFTLIEVLISTTILGMVLGVAMMTISGFMDIWQKGDILFSNEFVIARNQILLRDSLESVYEYYVTDKTADLLASRVKPRYFPFFKGGKDQMEFVTRASVFNHGAPAVARLAVVKNKFETYDLVYEEADLETRYIQSAREQIFYSRSTVMFSDLDQVSFRYYGVVDETFDTLSREVVSVFAWTKKYTGQVAGHVPGRIEIGIRSKALGGKKITFEVRAENEAKNGFFNPLY